jgi:putative membrane-bound dehydrogenase-like protein
MTHILKSYLGCRKPLNRFGPLTIACAFCALSSSLGLGARSSDPLTPAQALATLHLKEGFESQIVASEPLVQSPVAIDWGPDGRLWVAEMADYPYGIDGKGKPGGRIKVLESSKHDGVYDKATVFLDGINMPNGICVWRKGVIVTAAPDIFYAEDSKGDGKADIRKTLFTGFKAGNPQLRVNGLRWGMDGWIYCANGWSGGTPTSLATGQKLKLDGKDIRFKPDEGLMDLQSGQSEFGRDCDDFGDWFGCDNSHPLFHFVLDDQYLRRNPNVSYPDPKVQVITPANPKVFPVSEPQKRFYTDKFGYFTSGCGMCIYRDQSLFGSGSEMHMFICDPAYNLVHHEIVRESGVSFTASRPEDEQTSEFAASEDPWFRPVMARTGPDGALWVVDMYRYMIEHPDWLPENGKAELKQHYRDGEDKGRIYRIYRKGSKPAMPPRPDTLDVAGLVNTMNSANGQVRDMAQKLLIWRNDRSAVEPLTMLFDAPLPARIQALYTVQQLGGATEQRLTAALTDSHPAIRRAALRLAEPMIKDHPKLLIAALKLASDPDQKVQLQLACSIGEWENPAAGEALGKIGMRSDHNAYLAAAVMSSATHHLLSLAQEIPPPDTANDGTLRRTIEPLYHQLLEMAVAVEDRHAMLRLVATLNSPQGGEYMAADLEAFGDFLDDLAAHHQSLDSLRSQNDDLSQSLSSADHMFAGARRMAANQELRQEVRAAAVNLLGREPQKANEDLRLLTGLISAQSSAELRSSAVRALGRMKDDQVAVILTSNWPSLLPPTRTQAIDLLLGRESWSMQLLKAVRAGQIQPSEIDAAHRQRFNRSSSQAVKTLAGQVFGAAEDSRQKVIDEYQDVLKMPGDVSRGAKVFAENCAVCHRKGAIGNDIGPDLASVMAWQPDALLTAILDPNRQVEPRYLSYTATLPDGQSIFGIITSESGNSLTIKGLDAKEHSIMRDSIKSLAGSGRSLMPDGMEAALNKQAMADVIAFLRS